MYITIVHVSVQADKIAMFREASRKNHESSIREPGNLRFDILQSVDDPTQFVFYEAYKTGADAAAHKKTAHYLMWRDTVADWMTAPRKGVVYEGLYPVASS
ncbi:antibiotic biosynthesis monooxygenase [Nitrosomonas sp.]|uniref:antibiotic biosynthesis monooxygenase n=1 Tax=Nitrosomonas sp. TaxID=42353 RepID=UPI0025FA9010|nr:antibiotic biosynthesis monooxygenase [Nitrosomonas sp.]MCC6916025.1 antibiotic biosynthesis monooxygenase [Nitrosomonas sp.]